MATFIAVHLWQSTLFLIAAWLLALICRNNSASVRYWIWFGASAKFLVPFVLLQWLGDQLGRALPERPAVHPMLMETTTTLFVPPFPGGMTNPAGMLSQVLIVVGAIWILGAMLLSVRWMLQWLSIRSTLASAPQVCMDLSAPVRITSSDLATGVFGIFRPVVIVPRSVMRELDPQQLRSILAHEACHIHRRDNLTAAVHKCVEVLFWFHPLVWWVGANMLREREVACDESVIDAGHEQGVYAESILNVCRLGVMRKFSTIAASTGGDLTQRMESIMSEKRAQPIDHGRFTLLFMTVALACFIPFTAGVVGGAIREASDKGTVSFEAVTLKLSERGWRHSTELDRDAGRILLKNYSLRDLIKVAYPASIVKGDSGVIDRFRYDIEARWRNQGGTSERTLYRELLKNIVATNFNVEVYVNNLCDGGCEVSSLGRSPNHSSIARSRAM